MRTLLAVIFCTLVGGTLVCRASEPNPCGNHGNNCCTDDGGQTFISVADECSAFCESTATAVSVAVSEAVAQASASCSTEVAQVIQSEAATCQAQVAAVTAACQQENTNTCPQCPDVTVSTHVLRCAVVRQRKDGRFVGRRCLVVTEKD